MGNLMKIKIGWGIVLFVSFLSCTKDILSEDLSDSSETSDCGIDTTFTLPLPAIDIARYSGCRYILAGIYGTELLDELGNIITNEGEIEQ